MEHLKKLKKVKKKARETPIIEDLTAKAGAHCDLPFAFRYSYTEIPKVQPVGFQEKFSPFGPGRLDRDWDGQEAPPVPSLPRRKKSERKRHVIDSFNPPSSKKGIKPVVAPGPFLPGTGPRKAKTREEILGEPLTKEEIELLLQNSYKTKKQINLGRDGLTHNMLIDFYNYWTRERVVRVKCKGVATVDMENVITQIEDKTGGKVIHRAGGTLHVFRGRNYNNRERPDIPRMLWRPHSPLYPKLITQKPGGLKLQEANALRKRGRQIMPLCKLAKNGYYAELVQNVREAFEDDDLVRIDCKGLNRSDYKKVGAKLRDMVPCILLSFQGEQILVWKGKDLGKAKEDSSVEAGSEPHVDDDATEDVEGQDDSCEDIGESSGVDDNSDEDVEVMGDNSERTADASDQLDTDHDAFTDAEVSNNTLKHDTEISSMSESSSSDDDDSCKDGEVLEVDSGFLMQPLDTSDSEDSEPRRHACDSVRNNELHL